MVSLRIAMLCKHSGLIDRLSCAGDTHQILHALPIFTGLPPHINTGSLSVLVRLAAAMPALSMRDDIFPACLCPIGSRLCADRLSWVERVSYDAACTLY